MKKKALKLITSLVLLGTICSCGTIGPQGEKGDTGIAGKDGLDGKDGVDGKTPYIGENGSWWIGDIDTGIKATGDTGKKGDSGRGIKSTYINEEGHLIIVYDDETKQDVGVLKDTTYHTVYFYFKESLVYQEQILDGFKATIPPSDKLPSGYDINGWYTIEETMKTSWSFSGCTVTDDLTLYADYDYCKYTVTIVDTMPTITETSNKEITVTYKQPYDFTNVFNHFGYELTDFYELDSTLIYSLTGTWEYTSNKTIYTNWKKASKALKIYTPDRTLGMIGYNDGNWSDTYTAEKNVGESITINASLNNSLTGNYEFIGWYTEDNVLVSSESRYTFTMPDYSYTLKAVFDLTDRARTYATYPIIDNETKTIKYGLYPQTHVSDTSITSILDANSTSDTISNPVKKQSNGWYLYNNVYYAKLKAETSYDSTFSDGTKIVNGTSYWFKCEPITWKILQATSNSYLLLSSLVIDARIYNSAYNDKNESGYYANNYAQSELRTWLNNGFISTAFTLNSDYLQETTIDNSVATNLSSDNIYACENTTDKAFLLSYQDYHNTSYGFPTETNYCTERQAITSDYTRSKDVFIQGSSNTNYFTRSPAAVSSNSVYLVCSSGYTNGTYGTVSLANGVRPAIKINLRY